MLIISLVASPLNDILISRGYMKISFSRKFFNTLALWVPAIFLIILGYTKDSTQGVILLSIAVGFNAFQYIGFMCNHMDLSPNFAGSLMGLTNSIANILSIIGPLSVGWMISDGKDPNVKAVEWRTVFYVAAIFYFIGNLVFIIFGKTETQPWNSECKERRIHIRTIGNTCRNRNEIIISQ